MTDERKTTLQSEIYLMTTLMDGLQHFISEMRAKLSPPNYHAIFESDSSMLILRDIPRAIDILDIICKEKIKALDNE